MPRKKITIQGTDYEIGPDIDLDAEEIYLPDGTRLTEQRAAEIAEEIATRGRGRPSLTAPGAHSPHVSFRVSEHLRDAAEKRAAAEGKRVSQLAREALERYLAS